jgi:apolipoprotein N-acyltransferase
MTDLPAGAKATIFPLAARPAAGLASLGGTLYVLSFAGIDIWPLAFVAYVPTFFALYKQPARRATWLGLLAGVIMGVGGFYWLQNMLLTFSGFPFIACAFFTLVVCTYQAGRWALLGWLFSRTTSRGWPLFLSFAAAFVTSEITYPLLFPWYFAGSIHKVPIFTQTAELGGPILVGLGLLASNLALVEVLLARLERRLIVRARLVVPLSGVALTLLFGALRIRSVDARVAAAPAVRVGTVQANMGLTEKRSQFAEGMKRHMDATTSLRERGAEMIVWSETSAMYPVHEKNTAIAMSRTLADIKLPAIVGAVLYREDPIRNRVYYNTALSVDDKAKVTGRFDKTYLLMFGEYLPLGETFPILYKWSPNSGQFTAGKTLEPLAIVQGGAEHRVTTLICYEDIIPSFTRAAVNHADPEMLVNITNDAWFGDSTEPWEHLALAKFRAIEHRKYLIRSTNSGVSAIIDPVGRVVAQTSTMTQETLLETVHWLSGGRTLYGLIGDGPWWLVALSAAVGAFVRRRS